METIKTQDLVPNKVFASDLLIDKQFILYPANCPVPEYLLADLKEWKFTEIQTENAGSRPTPAQIKRQADEKKKAIAAQTEDVTDIVEKDFLEGSVQANAAIQKALEQTQKADPQDDKSKMEAVQALYNQYLVYITSVYTRYATHKTFNIEEINETIKDLVRFIQEHRSDILRINTSPEERNKKFLVVHCMRTVVLAVAIGLELKMPLTKLVELGVACMLHEIGMARLSPQVYMNKKPLTVAEKNQILTHPIISYNILKEANFPLSVQLGVLDHHERENGKGYPRHISGNNISLYAKIIAVVCSYEAITAPRHFKENASTMYEGMIEMLKNPNDQYDSSILKALLYSLSFYPIGTYVRMANGKVAQVVDVSPENPKDPIVQFEDESGTPQTVQSNETDMKIIRALTKEETAALANKQPS